MGRKKASVMKAQKKAFLEAMAKSFGNVTQAAKAVGVSRSVPYDWAAADPEFAREFNSDMYEEILLDAVDAKLAKLAISDENPTVLIFLAKTKGKKRGYIERTEHDFRGSMQATVDYTRLSEAALKEIAEQVPDINKT